MKRNLGGQNAVARSKAVWGSRTVTCRRGNAARTGHRSR